MYGRTRREVLAKLDQLRQELRQGHEPLQARAQGVTLGALLDEWLAALDRPHAGAQRPLTRHRYAEVADHTVRPYLGNLPIARLDADHIEDWQDRLQARGYAPRTVLKARVVLSAVIRRARRKRPPLLRENPLELVRVADTSRPMRPKRALRSDEARRFLQAIHGHRLETLLLLGLMAGPRRGELLGLSWGDVDLERRTVRVRRQVQRVPGRKGLQLLDPKTEAGWRIVPLPPMLVDQLRLLRPLHAGPDDLVFPSRAGTPIEPRNLNRAFTRIVFKAGLAPLTPHELRHSASTILLELGVSPVVVAALLGHTDPAVTLGFYSHVVPEAHREAVERMDRWIREL